MWLTLSRARRRPLTEPSLVQFLSPSSPFSSSSSPLSPDPPAKDDASADRQPSQPPPTSFLKDVRESLKKPDLTRWPTQSRPNSISSRNRAADPYLAQTPTLQEIRKNLSEYRRRSSAPSPDAKSAAQGQQQRHHMSFQQLYERNVSAEGDVDGGVRSGFSGGNPTVPGFAAFERIKESLKNSSSRADSYNIRAGSKQSRSKVERQVIPNDTGRMGNDYNKEYAYKELGEGLKKLRPEQKQGQKGWFSLQELSERLSKFRELVKDKGHCAPAQELKSCLKVLEYMKDTKDKVVQGHSTSILSKIGGTPDYLSMTPKEHLVEKYIHPDNMSSQEKMKLELAKVRDEFKMSESDCGSSRVQVAILTTKIKHLSSVLHKKDKHSRKGLQEMVQKRKKLLKYLRRTDWDSYCIVLSKLGLRDNPDYKNL